ncbi:MAG: peptidase S41, partial [Bacteroidetes bacterium]|nr:peptidase S41 [Bacteroidota bacterium]
ALLRQYKDVEAFRAGFTVGPDLTEALAKLADEAKIEPDSAGMARSKPLVDLRLKALIARDLWNTSAYWQVINTNNPVDASYDKALQVIRDPELQRQKLAER